MKDVAPKLEEEVKQETFQETLSGVGARAIRVERRRRSRHKVWVDVVVIPPEDVGEPFWATSEDICFDGLLVSARKLLPAQTPLSLLICNHYTPTIRVDAVVVHRVRGVGMGCRFGTMSKSARRHLYQLLQAHWV
jgi:hypothetical protein